MGNPIIGGEILRDWRQSPRRPQQKISLPNFLFATRPHISIFAITYRPVDSPITEVSDSEIFDVISVLPARWML